MVISPQTPEQLSLQEIEAACRAETRRYRRNEASDSRFCLELFHRALRPPAPPTAYHDSRLAHSADSDEEARTALVRIYTEFIVAHISPVARRMQPLDDLVQQVWMRFWRAAQHGLDFPTLEAALSYLKQTTVTVLIDAQRRARKLQHDESLEQLVAQAGDELMHDADGDLFTQYAQARFRVRCREVLGDSLEYRVFVLRYGLNMPPREIARELAQAGVRINDRLPTAQNISKLLERIFRQLNQDVEIKDLLHAD